jgi:hypothetical protein
LEPTSSVERSRYVERRMAAGKLFGSDLDLTPVPEAHTETPVGKPRLVHADRHQLRLESRNLDELVPPDHRVRALWQAVSSLDLSRFTAHIRAREAHAGRPAIDPCVLVALWLYATSEGIGSARQLSRLCRQHDVYRWICGGIEVCHRVLSDCDAPPRAVSMSCSTTSCVRT